MIRPVNNPRPLVLASASPRRYELLSLLGTPFTTLQAGTEERARPGESPPAAVQRFAREKAAAIAGRIDGRDAVAVGEQVDGRHAIVIGADTIVAAQVDGRHAIVIGADTIVVLDGRILGKPSDAAEAREMLLALRDRIHQVYTALALIPLPAGEPLACLALTDVPMRDYTDTEIERYVASGDPFDKAGAYAIQNHGFHPVPHLTGCYANVMGLPLCHLTAQLRRLDVHPPVDVPQACQAATGYDCPVYCSILDPQTQPCHQGWRG
jgi:septum formation protein